MREKDTGLPFAPLIDGALDRYRNAEGLDGSMEVPCKTVLYPDHTWFKAYSVFRAMNAKSTFDKPEVPHLSSDQFSMEAWKRLVEQDSISAAASQVLPASSSSSPLPIP
jgi:hypothetical protein